MKKIIALTFSIVAVMMTVFLWQKPIITQATNQDQCNEIFTYTKSSDFSDARVTINFESNDYQIDVSGNGVYQVIEVALDVDSDGHIGFFVYATGSVNNFNPNPGGEINGARVKVKKVCADPTATPTVSVAPSVTPTDVPLTPTPTNPPDQEVTPTNTPEEPKGDTTDHNRAGSAPQCGDVAPKKEVANFHLYRNGDDAILKWFPTEGNKVHIYYKENSASDWQHAVRDSANDGYEEIHGLGSKDITFAIQQAIGCSAGPMTQPIVDGPGDGQWIMFR